MMREVTTVYRRAKTTAMVGPGYLAAVVALCVLLMVAFLSFSLKAVLLSQVNQSAERDLQEVSRGFAIHVQNTAHNTIPHTVPGADFTKVTPETVLRSFIDRQPVDPNVILIGVTPQSLIQAEHAARKLHAGDELIQMVGSGENAGVVEKLDGPTYWATVEVSDAASSLLIVRFTGADRARATEIVRLLSYLAGSGAVVTGALWWAFRRPATTNTSAKTVFLRRMDAAELALELERRTGLTLNTPVSSGSWVKVDVASLAISLEQLARRISATELGADISMETVMLWVRNPASGGEDRDLQQIFDSPDMAAVRESTASHQGAAWVESTFSAGTLIGLDLPTVPTIQLLDSKFSP